MKKSAQPQPVAPPPELSYTLTVDETVATAKVDPLVGLSSAEAASRLEQSGPNALPEAESRSLIGVFFGQFKSPLIYLLFAAAAIALVLGHYNDAIVIAIVVLINAVVGAFQEGRAERSLKALRQLASQKARVRRDGTEHVILARDICPGDILILEAGDAIAADARLISGTAVQIAEAALTGESTPVAKNTTPVALDTVLADRHNMVYAGTHVTAGRGTALVVATGVLTEIGRIAALAETAQQPQTPLERRVAKFGRYVIYAAAIMFVLLNLIGWWRGIPIGEIMMVAISQMVGMIPEGLPVAMTIALAIGVQRMARRRAVVRRLAAVETLGCTTVICSDKTGTLTRNEMTVTALWLPDETEWVVTGNGYDPEGTFVVDGTPVVPKPDDDIYSLLVASVLCNDAQLNAPETNKTEYVPIGDPTEVALLAMAIKGGVDPTETRQKYPRTAEIPFDPGEKVMATWHDTLDGGLIVVKGAPEVVLDLSVDVRTGDDTRALDPSLRQQIGEAADRLAAQALRVLAIGVVKSSLCPTPKGFAELKGKVTLIGLLGQIDPPREEARDAVTLCRDAGIRPVMVTGDHKTTGHAIAKALGIWRPGDSVVDGPELTRMSDDELGEKLKTVSVFARVHPAQKLRIVDAYQKQDHVVAMTGDGVNDAPALVKADVGVAMGITGTEVAKESAKIVIADDNFATIVHAVEEGRVVYRNIQKVVLYLFATSMAEVLFLFLALLFGYPPPLVAVQILWVNLVTEGTVTVNLVMEPAEGDEMRRRPISPHQSLITKTMWSRILLMVPVMTVLVLGWFIYRLNTGIPSIQVQTEAFTMLVVCQWFNVLNCRSESHSALNLSLLKNPWLLLGLGVSNLLQLIVVFVPWFNDIFHTVPFGITEFFVIGALASSLLWAEEIRKFFVRRRMAKLGGLPTADNAIPQ